MFFLRIQDSFNEKNIFVFSPERIQYLMGCISFIEIRLCLRALTESLWALITSLRA